MSDEVAEEIRQEELGALSIEISGHADRVSEIFSKIDASMEQLPIYYQGSPWSKIDARYKELQNLYPVVRENITSYGDDLAAIVRKMREGDKNLSKLIQNFTEEHKRKIKAIESNQTNPII